MTTFVCIALFASGNVLKLHQFLPVPDRIRAYANGLFDQPNDTPFRLLFHNNNRTLLQHGLSIKDADDSRTSGQPLQEIVLTTEGSERLRKMSTEFKDLSTVNGMARLNLVSSTAHPNQGKNHKEGTLKKEVHSDQRNRVWSQAKKKMTTTRKTEISHSKNKLPTATPDPPMRTEPTTAKQLLKESTLIIRHESTTILPITTTVSPRYLIDTAGCKIPYIDPWHPSILKYIKKQPTVRCSATPDLVTLMNGMLILNETVHEKWYAKNVSQCRWREIKRAGYNDHINIIGNWTLFQNGRSPVACEFMEVQCLFRVEKVVYQTFFAQIIKKPAVEKNLKTSKMTEEKFNILLLGIDGVSHSRMIRQMPEVLSFLTKTLNTTVFTGFNKLGENTFPNMTPMLSGLMVDELEKKKLWKKGDYFDRVPIVWKDYAQKGYATQKAEDWADVGMFNYLMKGFQKQPVHYYMRPIFKHMAKVHGTWRPRCLAHRHETEFLLDYVQEFVLKFHKRGFFSVSHLTEIPHDRENDLSSIEEYFLHTLKSLYEKGALKNTILFVYGDHGLRWGPIRTSPVGYLEERLPFFSIALPQRFKEKYPRQTANLEANKNKLVTFLDVHKTFLNLLDLKDSSVPVSYDGKERSISLFSEIPLSRTCTDAHIPQEFCTCIKDQTISLKNKTVKRAAIHLLSNISAIVLPYNNKCTSLLLKKVVSAKLLDSKDPQIILIVVAVQVMPSKGIFEATIQYSKEKDSFSIVGHITRINKYGNQSWCVNEVKLKPFCFCFSKGL